MKLKNLFEALIKEEKHAYDLDSIYEWFYVRDHWLYWE